MIHRRNAPWRVPTTRGCMKYKSNKQYRIFGYDYSSSGYYFVTICVKSHKCLLGKVVGGCVKLSRIGFVAKRYWSEIPFRYHNVELDEWVIMPNHIHGIVKILDDSRNAPWRNTPRCVPTAGMGPLMPSSLSSIINHFKGNVKRWCNKNKFEYFCWQPRYHDRVIRNEDELHAIRTYIRENPLKWEFDTYYKSNKGPGPF